jgi:hypothetical protein
LSIFDRADFLFPYCSVENVRLLFVIPAQAGIQACFWIPAPRFCGDKFTPAKAGAGMIDKLAAFLQGNSTFLVGDY